MTEKKHIYESEVMALPPLRMVLGDIPAPDPEKQYQVDWKHPKTRREMEGTVKRLIAHLKENGDR